MFGNEEYIGYLNTLHSFNAQNSNAYAEQNFGNKYYDQTMVKIGLGDYIIQKFQNEEPQIIILTGHAGDGKTSIMYQVIKSFGQIFKADEKVCEIQLPNQKKCRCIKDFSELNDEEKLETFRSAMQLAKNGGYIFMVANTGPLINTFGDMYDKQIRDEMKVKFIGIIDRSTGEPEELDHTRISVINVASVDNTYFASQFLEKVIANDLWKGCENCSKKNFCHILRNRDLIYKNRDQVFEFLDMHYMWLAEHNCKLTIRSITEQLAFMITGGANCNQVGMDDVCLELFSNLFFGYIGYTKDTDLLKLPAIKAANDCHYDSRKLRIDEKILIEKDYDKYFGTEIAAILKNINSSTMAPTVSEFIRRVYLFTNISSDKEREFDKEDVFSKQFERYRTLTCTDTSPSSPDNALITDALKALYVGAPTTDNDIPITLKRGSGLYQNVQLVTGSVSAKKVSLDKEPTNDERFGCKGKKYNLVLRVEGEKIDGFITLPMLDYFEELRAGVISTNVDPVLTHGVETIKSQLSQKIESDDTIEMFVIKNDGTSSIKIEIADGQIRNVY